MKISGLFSLRFIVFVDQDQDSPVFGTFPSSAKLSSEDLIKIKNEILFAKAKTANLESEFSVEKSLGNMSKTKREILASHGHDIYLQVFNLFNLEIIRCLGRLKETSSKSL